MDGSTLASPLLLGSVPTVRGHHAISSPRPALLQPGSAAGTLWPSLGLASSRIRLIIHMAFPRVLPVARPHLACGSPPGPHVQPVLRAAVPRGFSPHCTFLKGQGPCPAVAPTTSSISDHDVQSSPSTAWSGCPAHPSSACPGAHINWLRFRPFLSSTTVTFVAAGMKTPEARLCLRQPQPAGSRAATGSHASDG